LSIVIPVPFRSFQQLVAGYRRFNGEKVVRVELRDRKFTF